MRAVKCSGFGDVEDVLEVVEDFPKPVLDPNKGGYVLLETRACALAPGDVRVVSGKTKEFQAPKRFPFVPGGDVSGVVVGVCNDETRLKVGDEVVSRFHMKPRGGLAQYTLAKAEQTALKPQSVDFNKAAALASSGVAALALAKRVKQGDRVLVIGGSGGVGSSLVQLARHFGASYVAATSSKVNVVRDRLRADDVIDYREQNVWGLERYKDIKFDVVFDLVGGQWRHASTDRDRNILKSGRDGGRFFVVTPDTAWFEIHTVMHIIQVFLAPALWRAFSSLINRNLPRYRFLLVLPDELEWKHELFSLVDQRVLDVVLDPASPFPFTTAGVRAAYNLQASRHCLGKAVVSLSPN